MTSVMIVEDQEMPRQLFEMLVNSSDQYRVVRSITNADMALFYCQQGGIDLVLMDVCTAMDASGLDAAANIKERYPKIKIIIVTSMPEFSWLARAKKSGVDSFWYKNVSKEPLLELMDRTMAGESIYPDETPEMQLGLTTNHDFSFRELEILRELTTGDSNAEIGERLGISANTVRNAIQGMMDKTGFKSRTELAVEARRLGIVIKDKSSED